MRCGRPGCRDPAEKLGLCPRDYQAAWRRAHRGQALDPTQSDWDMGSDGIVDDVAVSVAVSGERFVRLTPAERLLAARLIIHAGGDVRDLQVRLGVNRSTALALIREIRDSPSG